MKSALGVGISVEFWLPASKSHVALEEKDERVEVPNTQKSLRILAVDDDALVLMNTAAMLEELGHQVRDASSAQEALEIMRREPRFDIIVTDMAMPHMNGLEFARAIWSDWPGLPVLLATGYAELPEIPERKLQIVSKPFGQSELLKGIEAALAERAA